MKMKRILKWTAASILLVLVLWFFIAYWTSTNDCGRNSASKNPMKAIVYCDYGPANVRLDEIEKPSPSDDQILVKVRAVSVNPIDWHYIEGTPYIMRMQVGLRKPKDIRLGVDYSGTVEAVGKNVTNFKPGDDVFGGRNGAFAEYVCARADRGVANGASGGVGTFAVQIAKTLGADVTGVCSTRNLDLVKSLGADRVIDYTKEDFTNSPERYDVLVDNVANRSLSECRRVIKPNGRYVLVGGGGPNDQGLIGPLARPLKAMVFSWFVSQKMGMVFASFNHNDMATLADLMQAGKVTPVIDRSYKLAQVGDAIRYLEEGHARGKIILTVD